MLDKRYQRLKQVLDHRQSSIPSRWKRGSQAPQICRQWQALS